MGNNIEELSHIHDFGLTLNINVEIKSAAEKGMMISKEPRGRLNSSLPMNIYSSDIK